MAKKPSSYLIHQKEQLAAVVSPVRQEILDALAASGPSSAAQLAGRLGRPADALYHHLRLLTRVGLVLEHSRRRTAYRTEVVYATVGMARRFRAEVDVKARESLKNWERAVVTLLRFGVGDFRRALGEKSIVTRGPKRNLWCGRIKAYLSTRQLAQVNRLLDELFGLLAESRPAPGAKLFAVTGLLVPCQPTKRSRKSPLMPRPRPKSKNSAGKALRSQ